MRWPKHWVHAAGAQVAILLCLRDVAAGMAYLHGIGIMHSDLKGANVLLKNGRPSPDDPRGYTCKVRRAHPHALCLS